MDKYESKNEKEFIRKTFKFRCYPNKSTIKRAFAIMRLLGDIWCNALKDRKEKNGDWEREYARLMEDFFLKNKREANEEERKKIAEIVSAKYSKGVNSSWDQYHIISKKEHKNDDFWKKKYGFLNAQMMQTVIQRLDEGYCSYFGLKKNGDKNARKPGRRKYLSCITYRHQSGWKIAGKNNNVLELAGIGRFRMIMHRPIEGIIKTISVWEKNRKWYAGFSCEIEIKKGCVVPYSQISPDEDISCGKSTIVTDGSDRQKSCADNRLFGSPAMLLDGSDRQKSCADNNCLSTFCCEADGSDRQKSCADNKVCRSKSTVCGGNDRQKSCADNKGE